MAESYKFGATSFSNNVWIKGGGMFKEPLSVVLDSKGRIHVAIQVYKVEWNSNLTYKGQVNTGNQPQLLGINFPIGHLANESGNYKIKLVNLRSNATAKLEQGYVFYTK